MKQSNSSAKSGQKDNLEHYFNAIKNRDYTKSKDEVENWLYKANIQLINQKQERKLHKMKYFVRANKLKLVYTVITLFIVIGACNMPVTQTESAGNMITWSVNAENSEAVSIIDKMPWLKEARFTKNENTNNGKNEILYTAILQNSTGNQIENYCKELESIPGVTSLKILPMNYDVKRPLYSAALHNFFRINIDATGMNNQDLEEVLQKQLDEQGSGLKIHFKTGTDGRRDITIEHTGDIKNNDGTKTYEINIDDKNGKEKLKLMQKKADPEKFNGKTDDEIRKMVREELGNPDLKDDEILIMREGNECRVKIESNKEDIKK